MSNIEPVLDATEVRKILSVSEATLYRWLREARQGVGTLPLPVNTGGRKRRLLWTRSSILAFLDNRDRGRPPPPGFIRPLTSFLFPSEYFRGWHGIDVTSLPNAMLINISPVHIVPKCVECNATSLT